MLAPVLRPLRVLVEVPSLRSLLPLSLLGRLHLTALPVALSFLVASWVGSYTVVGVVTGAMALGQAVAGPVRGRVADRGFSGRVLVVTGVGYAVGLAALVVVALSLPGSWWPVGVVIAALAGLSLPPVSQVSRSLWPRLAEGSRRESLYALESTGFEIVSIVGPLLASGLVAVVAPWAGAAVCAVLAVLGALAFAAAVTRAGLSRPEPPGAAAGGARDAAGGGRPRSLLADGAFLRAVLVALGLVAALFSVDISVVAWGRDLGSPTRAGIVVALWALGSAIGGVIAAGRTAPPRLALRVSGLVVAIAVLAVLLPPVLPATPFAVIAVVALVGGVAVAPCYSAAISRVGALAPQARRAEAFGWLATASTVGAAVMLPVSGSLLDVAGPAAAIGAGAVATAVTALLAASLPPVPREERPVVPQPEAATGDASGA